MFQNGHFDWSLKYVHRCTRDWPMFLTNVRTLASIFPSMSCITLHYNMAIEELMSEKYKTKDIIWNLTKKKTLDQSMHRCIHRGGQTGNQTG